MLKANTHHRRFIVLSACELVTLVFLVLVLIHWLNGQLS